MKENLYVPSSEIYLPGVIDQFDTRASTFNKSAAWITDHKLVGNKTMENWGWQIYSATTKTNSQRFTL